MAVDAGILKTLIDRELQALSDARVIPHIRGLLVVPTIVLRGWDYGTPGEQYACWAVLNDNNSGTGIAYCESGFGPRSPWGLVWLGGDRPMSMGMDSAWFPTFLEAYFDSFAATELPIWRMFKVGPSGAREPLTAESSWDATWKLIADARKRDPASRYDCGHSIVY